MLLSRSAAVFALTSCVMLFGLQTHALASSSEASLLSQLSKGTSTTCAVCTYVVDAVKTLLATGAVDDCLAKVAAEVCIGLGLQEPYACKQIIKVYQDETLYLFRKTVMTPAEICGLITGDCGTPVRPFGEKNWTLPLPEGKPPVRNMRHPGPGENKNRTLRVLHLTDVHTDYNYTEGTEAECGGPRTLYAMCCKPYPDMPNAPVKVPAGKWGHRGDCDIPYRTLIYTLEHMKKNEKFDYIIWTGDLMDHSIWDYERSRHEFVLRNFTDLMLNYFPGVPIFAATGNHEGVPMDNLAPHTAPKEFQPSWLYQTFAETWGRFGVNDYESQRVIKYRASYSVNIMDDLRIISLNTIYGYNGNMLVYMDQEDPDGTLGWLASQLLMAEKAGEKVHIIGHIPSGAGSTHTAWSANYYNIVNRFESTIQGIFAGHTHEDGFNVFYEDGNPRGRPTAVTYISPSLTTHTNVEPSYTVFTVDKDTFKVQEVERYMLNTTEANESDSPQWKLNYKASEAYDMKDLSPDSWNELILRFIADPELLKKYLMYFYRRDEANLRCERHCAKRRLCEMRTAKAGAPELCDTIGQLANYGVDVPEKKPGIEKLAFADVTALLGFRRMLDMCQMKSDL